MCKFVCIRKLIVTVVASGLVAGTVHAEPNPLEGRTLYDLSQLVSKVAGYTLVISPRVRLNRKVEIYSAEDMPKEELLRVYRTILGLYGYAAIRTGGVIRVVRERKARSMPIPVVTQDNNK